MLTNERDVLADSARLPCGVQVLGGRIARSMDPYTQQRFTAVPGSRVEFELAGGVVYPTQSRIALTPSSSCQPTQPRKSTMEGGRNVGTSPSDGRRA